MEGWGVAVNTEEALLTRLTMALLLLCGPALVHGPVRVLGTPALTHAGQEGDQDPFEVTSGDSGLGRRFVLFACKEAIVRAASLPLTLSH